MNRVAITVVFCYVCLGKHHVFIYWLYPTKSIQINIVIWDKPLFKIIVYKSVRSQKYLWGILQFYSPNSYFCISSFCWTCSFYNITIHDAILPKHLSRIYQPRGYFLNVCWEFVNLLYGRLIHMIDCYTIYNSFIVSKWRWYTGWMCLPVLIL